MKGEKKVQSGRRHRVVKRKSIFEKIRRWIVKKMIRKKLIRDTDVEKWMPRPIAISSPESLEVWYDIKVIYKTRNCRDPLNCFDSLILKAKKGEEKYFLECLFDEQITVEQCVEYINRMLSDMESGKALKYFEIRKWG